MLARVAVHLPESLWLPEGVQFEPFSDDYRGQRVLVHPPLQSGFEVRPDGEGNFNVSDLYLLLTPVAHERVYPFVRMDGRYVNHANLLQIDFVRDSFERKSGSPPDPDREVIEAIVVNIVSRLRHVIGAPTFREFRLLNTFWTIRYLSDDGQELPEEVGLVRGRVNAPFKFTFTGLDDSSWNGVRGLAFDFQPQIWERLFLDAQYLLPEVGPALTLAIAAIETAADEMIRQQLPTDPDQAERLRRANRLGQRLDSVAKQLTGASLKEMPTLWDAFNQLRRARNASAHEGTPVLDGVKVDDQVALQMILAVRPVLDWIETRLPSNLRSRGDLHEPKWEWRSPVQSVPPVTPTGE